MKLNCKRIEIQEGEFSCSVTFYEKEQDDTIKLNHKSSLDQFAKSIGPYLSINRTYPEDDFETDYYYIELSDFDKSDEFKDVCIDLYSNKLMINFNNETFEIHFNIDALTYENLIKILEQVTFQNGQVNVHVSTVRTEQI